MSKYEECSQTFVTTTHIIMARSHFNADVWEEVIRDTVYGNVIDYTAQRLNLNHQTVFNMRHKILIALQ